MSADSVFVRPYSVRDKQQVIDVVGKTLVCERVVPESDLPLDDEDLQDIPSYYAGKSAFWVAEQNGAIVGTVGVKDKGNGIVKLRRMFVLHTLHGTGIGQKLLNTALSYSKQQGFTLMVLNTHPLMKRAHHFYEKNGFILKSKEGELYKYRYEKELSRI